MCNRALMGATEQDRQNTHNRSGKVYTYSTKLLILTKDLSIKKRMNTERKYIQRLQRQTDQQMEKKQRRDGVGMK